MARTVDDLAHRSKREAILDHAAMLVRTIGYEGMSIQQLIDGLGISRGALYHYFDSKQAVLEALVDRMGDAAIAALLPIIDDPGLTASEKFRRYVNASIAVKSANQELIADLMCTWHSEANVRLRHKLTTATLDRTAPMVLEPIIRQGVEEGTFDTAYPAETARIIAGIWLGLADDLIMLLARDEDEEPLTDRARGMIRAATTAVERILGASEGSLYGDQIEQIVRLIRPQKDK
ncbi:TetR/AcrR family transcriptional regulator [Microlunatus sp. Gsoil 973]|uniref:TetR/AcrR family transcriptional regulator n=1 Tax=Microlunatus sp. Gsoil 973 TaxID=2672569 RepID=UPI0012B4537C|nr:TetR/AcrR family transcriptional regulator [Microlunatus sp. Gsoil 973]QGN32153.1 TetR family transcriptional regulator [Microlunatus sp. Gsoil 973]